MKYNLTRNRIKFFSDEAHVDQLLTLGILVGSSCWFDTIPFGMVHCIYLGVSGYSFFFNSVFFDKFTLSIFVEGHLLTIFV